jgi:small subunit ribosomal protein S6
MRTYELIVLLHPDLEIDVDGPVSKIEKIITGVDGKVIKRDNWGKKRLAYRIKKHDFAIYIYFRLQLPPASVSSIEATLRITEEVIRHLLVASAEPSNGNKVKEEKAAVGAEVKEAK